MSSKLKVNNIIPSTGTQIGISTTGGGINLLTGTVVTGIITASGFDGPITQSGDFTIDDWIVHAGDTNTKFGFLSNDVFEVHTAGAERIRVEADGHTQVGVIGLSGGNDHGLTVTEPGGTANVLELATTNATGKINFSRNLSSTLNTTSYIEWHEPGAQGTGSIRFGTSPSSNAPVERLEITSGGGLKFRNADTPTNNNEPAQWLNHSGGMQLYASSATSTHRNIIFCSASNAASERLRIDSSGRALINTTAVTNTHDALTVKRAADNFTEMSMTVDANTSTTSAANSFIFTKSKHYYWNGLGFQSSHGHIGAIVGKRDSGGGDSDQEIRIEIGGTHINQSEEKTWNFKNNGDLSISDGNLIVASGHGIDFSAQTQSSATTGSELLNHYEEGTFTPYIDREHNSPIVGYDAQDGYYTRIGRVVYFYAEVRINSYNGNGSYGNTFLRGLPFNAASRTSGRGNWDTVIYHSYYRDMTTTDGERDIAVVQGNSEKVVFYIQRSENSWTAPPAPDANDQFKIGGYYFV